MGTKFIDVRKILETSIVLNIDIYIVVHFHGINALLVNDILRTLFSIHNLLVVHVIHNLNGGFDD